MANENNDEAAPKPLSQKTDAELKREASARVHHMSPDAANEFIGSVAESAVAEPIIGFIDFLREKAIVGLAVGFVIGSQVQVVANAFINNLVNPLIEFIFTGNQKLPKRHLRVHIGSHYGDFVWGAVVYALLDFLFVLLIIYAIIKIFKLDKKK